jgi:hypothetical protein
VMGATNPAPSTMSTTGPSGPNGGTDAR